MPGIRDASKSGWSGLFMLIWSEPAWTGCGGSAVIFSAPSFLAGLFIAGVSMDPLAAVVTCSCFFCSLSCFRNSTRASSSS